MVPRTVDVFLNHQNYPAWQAFQYEELFCILAAHINWSKSKKSTKQGAVGRGRECLPANTAILKNAHWFLRLSSLIDRQLVTEH